LICNFTQTSVHKYQQNFTSCRSVYTNEDGSLKKKGDIVRRPNLAQTLRKIARDGADAFYKGALAADIVADLNEGYGDSIITKTDLQNYK